MSSRPCEWRTEGFAERSGHTLSCGEPSVQKQLTLWHKVSKKEKKEDGGESLGWGEGVKEGERGWDISHPL